MKSVLIITEQFTIGGLETHIRGEILHLHKNGCRVHLAVGKQFTDALFPQGAASLTTGLSLGADATAAQMAVTVQELRKIIRKHGIDVVHAHPFGSLMPGLVAAEAEGIPAMITLHGPASLAVEGPLHACILKYVLLPNASATICVSDEVQKITAPYVPDNRLVVLPNGVHFEESSHISATEVDPRWCVVSRLDSFKIVGIHDFIAKAKAAGIPGVLIVGDGPAKQALQMQVEQSGFADFVTFHGYSPDAQTLMAKHAGVAGMGRVLLEGIAMRKPVVLVGYDGVKGLVTPEFFENAKHANFSGRGMDSVDANALVAQLSIISSQDQENLYQLARPQFEEAIVWSRLQERLRILQPVEKNVMGAVFDLLNTAETEDATPMLESPALLKVLEDLSCSLRYHSPSLAAGLLLCGKRMSKPVVEMIQEGHEAHVAEMREVINGLDEKISALSQALQDRDAHIQTLSQSAREHGARILDLNQSLEERHAHILTLNQSHGARILDLSQSLEERDAQIAGLEKCIDDRELRMQALSRALEESQAEKDRLKQHLESRDAEIVELHRTVASGNEQLVGKDAALHKITTSKSWRLTEPIRVARWRVSNPRIAAYGLGRSVYWQLPTQLRTLLNEPRHKFVRMVRGSQPPASDLVQVGDLTWEQFTQQVLSKRTEFRGVFVQELVIDWNVPLYQRPQHMAAALGKLGFLVIYKTDNWAGDDVNGFRQVSQGVWITNRREVDRIEGVIRSIYSTAYANTPELLMENGKRGFLIYEYIDHIDPEISGDDGNIKRLLALKNFAFSGGADLIVASARKLYEEAVAYVGAQKVALVQNGVDTSHYRNPVHQHTVIADKFRVFKGRYKTVIGYFGALAPWLWYETVGELVNQRPDLGFVFIGPDYYGGASQLPQNDNVLYMGAIDYKILPAYAQEFDVCFIPFKPGEIARTTSPLKLFEYFALEKPVVVTSEMAECVFYPEVFRGNSADELSRAIDDAIRVKDDTRFKKRLAQLADENDWACRAKAMTSFLGEEL